MMESDHLCKNTFNEKAKIFSHDLLKSCVYITRSQTPRHIFTKKLYSKLISTTHLLEDFLDFHGAKNNGNWYFYRELAAAVRHLSLAGYAQQHISNRFMSYGIEDSTDFFNDGVTTLDSIRETLTVLAPVILEEARRLKISIPKGNYDPAKFPGVLTTEILENDIDDEDKKRQKKYLVSISSEFLELVKSFDHMRFYEPYSIEEIKELVPGKINEIEIRRYEMLVHNLQSAFDSYVIHGDKHKYGKTDLRRLRGYLSILYHLFQIVGRLLHFYERHLHDVGYKSTYRQVRARLASIIEPEVLMDRIVNYGIFYCCHFQKEGKKLAKKLLNENIERSSITVGIPQKMGFHSRPSLMVAKIVQHYGGQVELCIGEDRFDASSVLNIQWAGGKIQKEDIEQVVFEGDKRALEDLRILAGVNYGEDSMGKGTPLPKELRYLK